MTIALTTILVAAALIAAYSRRALRVEVLTILIVSLPIVLWVPQNGSRWYTQVRWYYRLGPADARAVAPPVIVAARNLSLAQHALPLIALDATYAVVPRGRWTEAHADLGQLRYLESWLQYWLAPRIQVDLGQADWLVILDGAGEPLPRGTLEAHRFGDDLLVRR